MNDSSVEAFNVHISSKHLNNVQAFVSAQSSQNGVFATFSHFLFDGYISNFLQTYEVARSFVDVANQSVQSVLPQLQTVFSDVFTIVSADSTRVHTEDEHRSSGGDTFSQSSTGRYIVDTSAYSRYVSDSGIGQLTSEQHIETLNVVDTLSVSTNNTIIVGQFLEDSDSITLSEVDTVEYAPSLVFLSNNDRSNVSVSTATVVLTTSQSTVTAQSIGLVVDSRNVQLSDSQRTIRHQSSSVTGELFSDDSSIILGQVDVGRNVSLLVVANYNQYHVEVITFVQVVVDRIVGSSSSTFAHLLVGGNVSNGRNTFSILNISRLRTNISAINTSLHQRRGMSNLTNFTLEPHSSFGQTKSFQVLSEDVLTIYGEFTSFDVCLQVGGQISYGFISGIQSTSCNYRIGQ